MTWFVSTSDIIGLAIFSFLAPPIFALWFSVRFFKGNATQLSVAVIVSVALWGAEAAFIKWWLL